MHPNMAKVLGLKSNPVIFHVQTWPTPIDIPYSPDDETKSPKTTKK